MFRENVTSPTNWTELSTQTTIDVRATSADVFTTTFNPLVNDTELTLTMNATVQEENSTTPLNLPIDKAKSPTTVNPPADEVASETTSNPSMDAAMSTLNPGSSTTLNPMADEGLSSMTRVAMTIALAVMAVPATCVVVCVVKACIASRTAKVRQHTINV